MTLPAEERVDRIIESVLSNEGGYVNNPADRGAETRYGITIATARTHGYLGQMRDLPLALARSIYRSTYIGTPGFNRVLAIEGHVGEKLVDAGVNVGPVTASKFLQRALNALRGDGSRYPDLVVDGHVGRATENALEAYLRWRGPAGTTVILRAINSLQGSHYVALAEADPTQRRFFFGWMANRVGA